MPVKSSAGYQIWKTEIVIRNRIGIISCDEHIERQCKQWFGGPVRLTDYLEACLVK